MTKTILLTGATGYLGRYLSQSILEKGYKLVALGLNQSEEFLFGKYDNCKIYFLDETPLETIFQENKIDIVIHTATLYGRKGEDISRILSANVLFPLDVLTLAIKHKVSTFINTDTILVKNISPYALTKKQFSDWLEFYSDSIQAINLRLDHFYGPNDNPTKFIAYILQELKKNVPQIDLTDGSQTRDFFYIDDVVSAYTSVLDNLDKIPHNQVSCFEVGTNVKTSIREVVTTLKTLTKNTATFLNFGAIPYRKNEVLDYNINTTALQLLGWKVKTFFLEGLLFVVEKDDSIDKRRTR